MVAEGGRRDREDGVMYRTKDHPPTAIVVAIDNAMKDCMLRVRDDRGCTLTVIAHRDIVKGEMLELEP